MKHETVKKRMQENTGVHKRTGPHEHFSDIFVKTWGHGWKSRLDACGSLQQWKEGKHSFVSAACGALGLPAPPDFLTMVSTMKPSLMGQPVLIVVQYKMCHNQPHQLCLRIHLRHRQLQ